MPICSPCLLPTQFSKSNMNLQKLDQNEKKGQAMDTLHIQQKRSDFAFDITDHLNFGGKQL
jgi:hypothetical protein